MDRSGVTLLEILFAIVIITILAAIGGASAMDARRAADIAVMESDLKALALAQEVYLAESGGYFGEEADPNGDRDPRYTRSKRKLDFTPSHRVKIKIRANKNGWAARAEHLDRRPDRFFCAIFVGDINAFAPAEEEGVVECEPKRKKKKKKK
jgi:prepilin-type N-terminal cleavage/methylation domain-containing protein